MSKTCLVTSTDHNFLWPTETMLKSLDKTYEGERFDVFVLVPADLVDHKFETQFKNFDVSMVHPEGAGSKHTLEALKNLAQDRKEVTTAYLYRFFMADVLIGYDKAVYLDSDTLIARNIAPLLQYKLVLPLAACQEPQLEFNHDPMFKDTAYFNSGVLITDLNYWREQELSLKLVERAITFSNPGWVVDQNLLNWVFRNNWTPLPMGFNYLVNIHKNIKIEDPIVVHWAGKHKPWKSDCPQTKWSLEWRAYNEDVYRKMKGR